MKKRLRKKKHIGEFAEWGIQLVVIRNRKDGFDDFLDAFIEEAIESNGCYCGGGGKEDMLDVVVELGLRSNDPDTRIMKITAWLDAREDVQSWRIGPKFDIWYSGRPRWQMKAEDFDNKFELGEDLTNGLDFSKARRPSEDAELRAIVEARKNQPEIKVSIDEL